ncbi:MAG: hypothetical protein B9S32_01365 [Verrucomicrobia bacterium Tous-C9LFEB]|nr:MAG: hypothetical protein B9S32_01365 [Verrucomicrobia bacterium Tous-C9LFEB]
MKSGSHSHHAPRHPFSTAEGPRQLAPAVMGRKPRSRHMAMMRSSASLQQWFQFVRDRTFWTVGGVVTALTLTLLWCVKDLPALPRTDWAALKAMQNWKPTFFIREQPPVIENGQVVKPGETYYTVPSTLSESR